MKLLKSLGLALFIIGFGLFNFSFFWARYQITPEVIRAQVSDLKKSELLIEASTPMLNQEFSSNFKFVDELHGALDRVNQHQLNLFGISEQEIDQLVARNQEKFSIASVDSVFAGSKETTVFKRKAFRDYGSWVYQNKR